MKDLIIFGSGGHARSVVSIANSMNKWNILSIVDLNFNGNNEYIYDVPVESFDQIIYKINPSNTNVFIAIGNNIERFNAYKKIEKYNFYFPNLIHPLAFLDPTSQVGKGNYIGQFSNLGAYSKIGDFNIINTYSNIEHEVSIGNFNQLSPGAIICGRSTLKCKTFMGANSVIIDKLKIAERTTIGAGAVVIKDIEFPNNTYIGVPAKIK